MYLLESPLCVSKTSERNCTVQQTIRVIINSINRTCLHCNHSYVAFTQAHNYARTSLIFHSVSFPKQRCMTKTITLTHTYFSSTIGEVRVNGGVVFMHTRLAMNLKHGEVNRTDAHHIFTRRCCTYKGRFFGELWT